MALTGKRVLVVGGTSGLGLATARAAQEAGAEVLVAGRLADGADAARAKVGGNAVALPVERSDEASIRALCERAGPLADVALRDGTHSMMTKLWAALLLAQDAQLRRDGGSVVLVSGLVAKRLQPGQAVMAAVNAAVEGLVRALAVELTPLRVNAVSPGLVPARADLGKEAVAKRVADAEQRLPARQAGQPEDIAAAALFLMTNAYATGTVLDVDGGGAIA